MFTPISQIVLWLKITVYLMLRIRIIWVINIIRRSLGFDNQSTELMRIRRILQKLGSQKLFFLIDDSGF